MRVTRSGWVTGAAVFLALAGCGGCGGSGHAVPETAGGSLEELASLAGCEPDIQTDAEEIRRADCTSDAGRYVLAAFRTDRGQREWLDAADDYGGSYLVGRRWIVVGEVPVLEGLRGRLGGTVVESSHHSGNSGGGGSEEHHPGHGTS